jgi:hypothetical protein
MVYEPTVRNSGIKLNLIMFFQVFLMVNSLKSGNIRTLRTEGSSLHQQI